MYWEKVWERNWRRGKEKLYSILRFQAGEAFDVETRIRILKLWETGRTFDCVVQCDARNNPPSVMDVPDIMTRISIDQRDGWKRYVDISLAKLLGLETKAQKESIMIHSVKSIQEHSTQAEINGKWVPARPLNPFVFWWRIKDAWMVFCGKADVLVWPEDQ